MALHEGIYGQPETHSVDCEFCRKRDATIDGTVQLKMLKRVKKEVQMALKDVSRIAHLLDAEEKQMIADGNDEAISTLNEILKLLR
jgi:hypothetical protein